MVKYIAVAGNMGSGKSSLVQFLCRRYPEIRPFYERNEENPYLADFYQDMGRWALQSQIYFLTLKFGTHQELDLCRQTVIQDRTIYEDAEVFCANLRRTRKLSARDHTTYLELYRSGRLNLDDMVTSTYSIDEAPQAIADMQKGINARGVIVY